MSYIGVYYKARSLWGDSSMEAETRVNNELAEVGVFSEGDREGLVTRSWVDGSEERILKPSLSTRLRR